MCILEKTASFGFSFLSPAGGPSHARGSVIGHINDVEFGIAFLNATVIDGPDEDITSIEAKITNIPWNLGTAVPFMH